MRPHLALPLLLFALAAPLAHAATTYDYTSPNFDSTMGDSAGFTLGTDVTGTFTVTSINPDGSFTPTSFSFTAGDLTIDTSNYAFDPEFSFQNGVPSAETLNVLVYLNGNEAIEIGGGSITAYNDNAPYEATSSATGYGTLSQVVPTPEPASLLLTLPGAGAAALQRRRLFNSRA
jgi:hypothetical protein